MGSWFFYGNAQAGREVWMRKIDFLLAGMCDRDRGNCQIKPSVAYTLN